MTIVFTPFGAFKIENETEAEIATPPFDMELKMKPELILKCRICRQDIGRFRPERLLWPVNPGVFESLDPEHGWPPPFMRGCDWDSARCPYCRKKPYYWTEPSKILTDDGLLNIEDAMAAAENEKRGLKPSEIVHCRYCGEGPFPNYQARVAHERSCDARETPGE